MTQIYIQRYLIQACVNREAIDSDINQTGGSNS